MFASSKKKYCAHERNLYLCNSSDIKADNITIPLRSLVLILLPYGNNGHAWLKYLYIYCTVLYVYIGDMDADLEHKVSRYGRRLRQLVVIPDADVSDAETESDTEDETRESSDSDSDWSSEDDQVPLAHLAGNATSDDDIPLAQLLQTQKTGNALAPSGVGKEKQQKAMNFRWRDMNQPFVDTTWKDQLPEPPEVIGSPVGYFRQFFTRDIAEMIVSETNKYAIQSGAAFMTTLDAVHRYVGILLRMGIVHMPRYRMYWSSDLRYNAIADFTSRKEFEDMGRYIHFNDNVNLITNRKDAGYDQLYKVRPLLTMLRNQCMLVAPEQRQSVDEQIIPFKGKNRLRQYLPKKPKRWGFKVIARCCARTGFTHDFTIYQGLSQIYQRLKV